MTSNFLWTEQAAAHGAEIHRVQVWDALSELFLDSYRTPEELSKLDDILADSPFSFRELGHILFCEVGPVCFPNTLMFVGGEGMGFSPDWLIERCLARQKANPFLEHSNSDEPPLWMHFTSPIYLDGYLMISRVQKLRAKRH